MNTPLPTMLLKLIVQTEYQQLFFPKVVEMNPAEAMAANLARLSYSATLRVCLEFLKVNKK